MGLKAKFTKADVAKHIAQLKANINMAVIQRLSYIGEQFVILARTKGDNDGGFNDITGNLRSSIGYVVLDHGKTVQEGFEKVVNGDEGMKESKALIKKLKSENKEGFVLIVVAGMDYAAAVENRHHKDVITGSSLVAETMLRDSMKNLEDKIGRL